MDSTHKWFFKLNVDAAGPNKDGKCGLTAATRVVVVSAGCLCTPLLPVSDVVDGMSVLKRIELVKDLLFLKLK
jgi:hypothetical protein